MIRTTFQFQLVLIFLLVCLFVFFFFDVVSFLKLNYPVILFLDVYKIIANDIGNHLWKPQAEAVPTTLVFKIYRLVEWETGKKIKN